MARRPRRVALGLRGRIVGAVLVTTVATLAIAALALLGPLESSLKQSELKTLRAGLRHATNTLERFPGALAGLSIANLEVTRTKDEPRQQYREQQAQAEVVRQYLQRQQQRLQTRLGAAVYVFGEPDVSGRGRVLTPYPLASYDPQSDVAEAFLEDRSVYGFGSINDSEYARAAIWFTNGGLPYVLAVRKPIGQEIPAAVKTVRTAFLTAALAGLALTMILAFPLAGTLVRRLRRLRQTALRLAREGPTAQVPEDRASDEVGDLGRSFALMQRQLHQQEQARRAFIATASHELRTPLASLDGMLELLDEDLESGEPDLDDARALLARARVQSRRLGRLAVDLLDLSRIDAQVQLRSEPIELGELSRAVVAEFELGTSERGITFALEGSDGQVWALGDPGSVARILRILLDNAVRVTPDGAEVSVALHRGRQAMLSVCDQGPGVPADEREMIFERFQRGRSTRGQAGFGLGLAIGRELAERMGGELLLENRDGSGARFTLRLPVARAPARGPVPVR